MLGIVDYIRSWFTSDLGHLHRKRRASDEIEDITSYKTRRLNPRTFPNENRCIPISTNNINCTRRFSNRPFVKEIINLDDIPDKGEPLHKLASKHTSTPANMSRKYSSLEKSRVNQKLTPRTDSSSKTMNALKSSNRMSLPLREKIDLTSSISPVLATQLDDKKEFQHLLESHLSNNSSKYFSASSNRLSKYYNFSSDRGQKMLSLAVSSRPSIKSGFIDLTKDSFPPSCSRQLSVSDTIKKVLKNSENGPIDVASSESDVEVVVRPPSPKPDIQIKPINSLKVIVDSCQSTKDEWLTKVYENHKKRIEERTKALKNLEDHNRIFSKINKEMQIKCLANRVERSLFIKDKIIPLEEIIEPELPLLTDEHLRIINDAFRGRPGDIVSSKFNLNIARKDILTLNGLNWLNDEVINFYMNLIMERGSNDNYPKTHCFNTFFYPKLLKDGPSSLRRWTKKIDLFSKDLICVPIHLGVHWCMAIVDLENKLINYYDSMGSSNSKCLIALRNYLEEEHLDKKKTKLDTSEFILENVKDIPQQMNGSDCGMFACTFAEFYSRRAPFTFKQDDMPYFRNKMVVEIVTGQLLIE